ncbi:MAG: radical SAM protein [Candidatus Woesearchaeota archaeon]
MLNFNDLEFSDKEDKIRVTIYRMFYKEFLKKDLIESIGDFKVKASRIIFGKKDNEMNEKKLMQFIRKFKKDLTYSLNGNRSIYVDEDLGMPMIGLNFLGIVDKGSEMIEVKPITNCNADCSFCSVNEGCSSKKQIDFVVDKEYLMKELNDLLEYKKENDMSVWINPHGEPTLYSELVELCDDILANTYVKDITVITNGILLNKHLVKELKNTGEKNSKDINIAISLSGSGKNAKIMGKNYDPDLVIKNIEYVAKNLHLTITPVYIKGVNESDIKKIIELSNKLSEKSRLMFDEEINVNIQKFCCNKFGRKPIKEQSWEEFDKDMKRLEQETGKNLLKPLEKLKDTKTLPKLCEKNDIINVNIISPGRFEKDKIGVLERKDGNRAVLVLGCKADNGIVKVKVVQSKYNITIAKS